MSPMITSSPSCFASWLMMKLRSASRWCAGEKALGALAVLKGFEARHDEPLRLERHGGRDHRCSVRGTQRPPRKRGDAVADVVDVEESRCRERGVEHARQEDAAFRFLRLQAEDGI